jgi:3-methyladenine DNA glycosylase AlkD
MREKRNPLKAPGMQAYMKHHFHFLGLQKAERLAVTDPFIKEKCHSGTIDTDFVRELWSLPEREIQYTALHYLGKMKKHLKEEHLSFLKELISTKSWWDTVDSIAPLVGSLVLHYPGLKENKLVFWTEDRDLWVRRVSIIFQLKYKRETDTRFLSRAILANFDTGEFFLNKAIGWALREYSKTDPEWVRNFISAHKLHSLSIREGSKYI